MGLQARENNMWKIYDFLQLSLGDQIVTLNANLLLNTLLLLPSNLSKLSIIIYVSTKCILYSQTFISNQLWKNKNKNDETNQNKHMKWCCIVLSIRRILNDVPT